MLNPEDVKRVGRVTAKAMNKEMSENGGSSLGKLLEVVSKEFTNPEEIATAGAIVYHVLQEKRLLPEGNKGGWI